MIEQNCDILPSSCQPLIADDSKLNFAKTLKNANLNFGQKTFIESDRFEKSSKTVFAEIEHFNLRVLLLR